MFKYNFKVPKTCLKTTYGSICIENIIFDPNEIEKMLPQIVLEEPNLKHMFAEDELNDFKKKNIYRRFIPKDNINLDINTYVQQAVASNVNFYSFLAEGILGLVFRDLYGLKLARGIIDVTDTLTDTHTGVDSCMYNSEKNIIVLGEAKFYENLSGGINKIIEDFIKKNIKNKLESLKAKAENNEESYNIVIKNLSDGDYNEKTLEQFMNQKIIFAGFVLHSEKNSIKDYNKNDFYNKYQISSDELKANIGKCLCVNGLQGDFEIVLVHIPVCDKKSLIVKMIEQSKIKLSLV